MRRIHALVALALLALAPLAYAGGIIMGPVAAGGGAPSVRATNSENLSSAGTSLALNLPASLSSGEEIFAVAAYGIGTTTGHALDTPNYTDASDTSITQVDGSWHYKVSNGGEGAEDTLGWTTSSRVAAITLAISGTDGSPTVACGTSVTGTDAAPNPPSVAFTAPALLIAFYMTDNSAGVTHSSDPTGYTHSSLQSFDATSEAVGVATCQATVGTDCSSGNPAAFGLSGAEQWIAQTCVVEND